MTAPLPSVRLKELLDCKICGKPPMRGGLAFMGHHIECINCGIAYPFPPAGTVEQAVELWNEMQANVELTGDRKQAKPAVGRPS